MLVVDDYAAMRDLLELMVAQVGCEPIEVDLAKDALDHIEKGQAHMMLLDLQMPGASGLNLLRSCVGTGSRSPSLSFRDSFHLRRPNNSLN